MKKSLLIIVVVCLILGVLFLWYTAPLMPKHGVGRFSASSPIKYYDADKKKWVSEAEWLTKYTELPSGYLSKEEWDNKRR